MSLRVREVNGSFEQTVKVPIEGSVGMLNFEEWTVPLTGKRPDLALFDPAVIALFNPRNRGINLQPMFTTDIDRRIINVEYRRSKIELALDQGRIVSHASSPQSIEVCELELELQHGSPGSMLDFAIALNEEIDIVHEHRTKAQRGYALVRKSLKPGPTKAKYVELEAQMTSGQAFHAIIGNALEQLHRNEIPTLEGVPGGIHQARVSIRRIRAALRAFKRVLPYDKRKAFNGEFRWFQLRLAPARDWHVFVSETLPRIEASHPNAGADLERLRKLALAERRRATRDARELFKSRRYTRLLLQFQRWLITLKHDKPPLNREVSAFARDVLRRSRRDFLVDTRPLSRMTMEELHNLRKRGKKARYATEFFAGLWDEEAIRTTVETMQQIQDLLGEVNDASVARQVLAGVPANAMEPSAVTLVQNWSGERSRQCIRAGQSVWRKFHRSSPF